MNNPLRNLRALAQALRLLEEERTSNFGTIPVVAFAAGVANDRPEWQVIKEQPAQ